MDLLDRQAWEYSRGEVPGQAGLGREAGLEVLPLQGWGGRVRGRG